MVTPVRGEVWWGEIESVGRRLYLVMTRTTAIQVLHSVIAAPVTRTVRGIPSELVLNSDDRMPTECAASFDNLTLVPNANLTDRICALSASRLTEACAALRIAVDC